MRVRGRALVRHCSGFPASAAQVILATCDGQTDLQCADDCVTDLSAIIVLWYDQSTMILGKMGSSVRSRKPLLALSNALLSPNKSLAPPKAEKSKQSRWQHPKWQKSKHVVGTAQSNPFKAQIKLLPPLEEHKSPHIVGGTLKVAQAHT